MVLRFSPNEGTNMTATNRPLTDTCSGEQDALTQDYALANAFLENRRGLCSQTTLHSDSGAARHFLLWLDRRCIPVASVDDAIIDRFARHRCRCGRYRPRALKTTEYLSRVRRFIRFLEDRGDIPVVDDVEHIGAHLADFGGHLEAVGYSLVIRCGYRSQAEHLAVWLRLSRIRWRDVDDAIIERFAQH